MSSDARLNAGGSSRSKRRPTDATDEDGRQITAAEDPASNPKRQRVSRACDSCRTKKDKCDGAQPVCSTCASLSRPCTYRANPKKRGLPTGYIRTLELLWGLVFTKIQGSEEVVRSLLKAANIPSHLATMGKEAEGSDTLLSSFKNSIVLKEIERLLLSLEHPEDDQGRGARNAEEGTLADTEGSVLSPETLEWRLPDAGDERENSSPVMSAPATAATVRQTSRTSRNTGTQTADPFETASSPPLQGQPGFSQDHQQLPSNPWPLLDIYFSYTQCWFPILEKHDILRTAFRHADDQYDPSSSGSGDQAALWAVLALASIQQTSISVTRQLTDFPEDHPDPNQLYAKARSLIPGENGAYEVGHVQALLILSLIKLGQQDWAAAWILVGQAVRIAQSLGLGNFDGPASVTEGSRAAGRSKHVFLGCFLLETLVAAQTGYVPSLRKNDLTKIGAINEDGLEEWHPWEDQTGLRPVELSRSSFQRGPLHALSTFNRLLSLMCILNDLCCWSQASDSLSYLEALERQLQHWVSSLPRSYRIDLQTVPSRVASPHIFGLEMMYEAVASAISLQLAVQKNERSGLRRVSEGSKRLISLLQAYMETYSLSATCPTFGAVLTLGLPRADKCAPWVSETEPGIKHKLQSFSAHLATVWAQDSSPRRRPDSATPLTGRRGTYASSSLPQSSGDHPHVASVVGDTGPANHPTPDSLSAGWMRTSNNAALSLPTPSSLNIAPGIEVSNSTCQPIQHRSSISGRPSGTSMPSDLATPFSGQYQPGYNDSLQFNSLANIDGVRRSRIAPDLDTLFDELASLEGIDRMDTQPEFMQNLGFIPEAGIPELYPYASQTEPFLLAPTQTLRSPETNLRRGSQVTGECRALNAR
ncbi:fungal-specific transcription factor domain-containing protein [Aspergillus egyptiacus]|nr:fungal-specific transcription factor domain-containing protein [Aspergillus egyptiacus]